MCWPPPFTEELTLAVDSLDGSQRDNNSVATPLLHQ
jgi:hypothetical protein